MARVALLDLSAPILADNPSEWPVADAETLALLRPSNGIFTIEQDKALRRISAARWFLLRNDGPSGQAWRCGRCGLLHDFFTLHCRPRPYNGLTHAIGTLVERIGPEQIFSAVEIGTVEPITVERAFLLYHDLRGYGYSREQILGVPDGVQIAERRRDEASYIRYS